MVERSTTKTIKAIENVDIDVKEVDDLTFRIIDRTILRSKAGILGSSSAEMKAKGNIYKKSSKMNV